MNQASREVQLFFQDFEKAANTLDTDIMNRQYSDSFLFGDPNKTQTIEKEKFLEFLPQRKGFFDKLGRLSSKILELEQDVVSGEYLLVKSKWLMTYQKGGEEIKDENFASYLVFKSATGMKIVAQIDHQDLMEKVQDLGLLVK